MSAGAHGSIQHSHSAALRDIVLPLAFTHDPDISVCTMYIVRERMTHTKPTFDQRVCVTE